MQKQEELYLSKAQNIEILHCILTNNHGNHASYITKSGAVAIINSVVSIEKTLFVTTKLKLEGHFGFTKLLLLI